MAPHLSFAWVIALPVCGVPPYSARGYRHRMSSSGRFSSRKHNLLFDALNASGQTSGDYTEFNRCMSEAKAKGLTWVQGLDYTVKKLQPMRAGQPEQQQRRA